MPEDIASTWDTLHHTEALKAIPRKGEATASKLQSRSTATGARAAVGMPSCPLTALRIKAHTPACRSGARGIQQDVNIAVWRSTAFLGVRTEGVPSPGTGRSCQRRQMRAETQRRHREVTST